MMIGHIPEHLECVFILATSLLVFNPMQLAERQPAWFLQVHYE
ncbi:MAG: hypothetical protein WAR39_11460 [Prevotella sp.]